MPTIGYTLVYGVAVTASNSMILGISLLISVVIKNRPKLLQWYRQQGHNLMR